MDILTIILLSIGLAMDCFAVSLSAGAGQKNMKFGKAFTVAMIFGIFQSGMMSAGWAAGKGIEKFITAYDHWVAFGLLAFIGIKMIYEALRGLEEGEEGFGDTLTVIVLAFATSIDALAAGVSYSFLSGNMALPVASVGAGSFIFSIAGVYIGKKAGEKFGKPAEIVGGLILIGIGVKILLEHLK